MVTLYQRLRLTPQQRQLAAALWKCWASRRRTHDRAYATLMRHLSILLPSPSKMPLRMPPPPSLTPACKSAPAHVPPAAAVPVSPWPPHH